MMAFIVEYLVRSRIERPVVVVIFPASYSRGPVFESLSVAEGKLDTGRTSQILLSWDQTGAVPQFFF